MGKVHAMLACDVVFLFVLFEGGGDPLFHFGHGVTFHLLVGNIFQQVLHLRYVVRSVQDDCYITFVHREDDNLFAFL